MKKLLLLAIVFTFLFNNGQTQSVAREWNDVLLEAIRHDLARPTVHARNLFHTSVALYDAFAVYDSIARPYFLGNEVDGFECPFDGVDDPIDIRAAQEMAMSYAAYRLLVHRFQSSPGFAQVLILFQQVMANHGYDALFISQDYTDGNPASLGNYLGQKLIEFGLQDGSNEIEDYGNQFYSPVNSPLVMAFVGNPDITDYNRWQPLTLDVFIDQSGNVIPFNTPPFLNPEWGVVSPFAMTEEDAVDYERGGFTYKVYHDPGLPPQLDIANGGPMSEAYQWGFSLVASWSSHLDPTDGVMQDISPNAQGNLDESQYPRSIAELPDFYDWENGGDISTGRTENPKTGLPYEENIVARGDYARILAEFWADGPESETPPGHWFTLLNYVNDHPDVVKRFRGQGPQIDDLEWDVKGYFTLGGAMHDAAITSWGIKGWYDYLRPVSAIRAMAELGQSSDSTLSSYHIGGLPLVDGRIELVEAGDPLEGVNGVNIGEVKVLAWKGPDFIEDPTVDEAGVDWILAVNWWPYQRPSFVTPNFAGYISGHSTYSRAAAEVLTALTGDPFFPGGMGEFIAPKNEFLVFEQGPTDSIKLQWATYRDASDQCSLSRIWGGIHPPADDIPGRLIGIEIGGDAINLAESYFYTDADEDGFYSYLDCDDHDALLFPGQLWFSDEDGDGFSAGDTIASCFRPTGYVVVTELLSMDIDCDDTDALEFPGQVWFADTDGDGFSSGEVLESCTRPLGFAVSSELLSMDVDCNDADVLEFPGQVWYADTDEDGFSSGDTLESCARPTGFVVSSELMSMSVDCDDTRPNVNPDATEICDELDNNCDGEIDEGVQLIFYADTDDDGFGDLMDSLTACEAPMGYVQNSDDCNDENGIEFPGQTWFEDADNDGYSTGNTLANCSRPLGYRIESELSSMQIDCDDENNAIHPAAVELCDEVDNNCDGNIDEDVQTMYYADTDNDGFGDADMLVMACEPPMGYVTNAADCNDADGDEFPGQTWYFDEDGDGYSSGLTEVNCLRPTNCYLANELTAMDGDCDDGDNLIHPAAVEVCDEIDNNCDGTVDEGVQSIFYADFDSDGYGDPNSFVFACALPSTAYTMNASDCNDGDANEYPGQTWYADVDQDGYSSGLTQVACLRPANFKLENELNNLLVDCDDNSHMVHPDAIEIPDNNIDEDCSGFDLFLETKIFPNPFREELTVHINTTDRIEASLYNASGQLMIKTSEEVIDNYFLIDLSHLPSGLYILDIRMIDGQSILTEKVVKL